MIDYSKYFVSAIKSLKDSSTYRTFARNSKTTKRFPIVYNSQVKKDVVIWCTNDVLGMSVNQKIAQVMSKSVLTSGVGAGGTRNIGGDSVEMYELEKSIAAFHDKAAALVTTSGYIANLAALGVMARLMQNLVYISDEKNHNSVIAGIKEGVREHGATKEIYKHNDIEDLESILKKYDSTRPKIIVSQGIFSMDGDVGKISDIVAFAKKYGAMTYVDEVHSVGIYGERRAGVAMEQGVGNDVDIIQGTFGKAFGVFGGYIAASVDIIDAIRSYAPSFIFTTALPPAVAAAIKSSVEHLKVSSAEQNAQRAAQEYFEKAMLKKNIPFVSQGTHIIIIPIGDNAKCKEVSHRLLYQHGIYMQPINYPTVPNDGARLRVVVLPEHSPEMIRRCVDALAEVFMHFDIGNYQTHSKYAA